MFGRLCPGGGGHLWEVGVSDRRERLGALTVVDGRTMSSETLSTRGTEEGKYLKTLKKY